MMSIRNPWKNSWTIRLVAVIDIAFAGLLVSIYLQKLLSPMYNINDSNGVPRAPTLKLFLLGPIIFNSFQIVMSFNLFSAARRGNELVVSYAKAHTWFQFSTVMLVFLMLKLFLILWFPPLGSISRRDIFGATLIVLESVFKIFGLFVVREFIDDLQSALSMFPVEHLYCIYTPPVAVSSMAALNNYMQPNASANINNVYPSYTCTNLPQHSQVPKNQPATTVTTVNAQSDAASCQQNRNSTIIADV